MSPSASEDPEPSTETSSPDTSELNDATGAELTTSMITSFEVLAVSPSSSVTVRVTVYVPASAYVCSAVSPSPVAPSPKSQA